MNACTRAASLTNVGSAWSRATSKAEPLKQRLSTALRQSKPARFSSQAWPYVLRECCTIKCSRELAKIDGLEAAAWQAWERSCGDSETLHTGVLTGRTDKDGSALPDVKKSWKTVKGQSGDARFLDIVHTCIAQRCKLLGLMPNRPEFGGVGVNVATTGPVVFYIPQNGRDQTLNGPEITAAADSNSDTPSATAVKVVLPEPHHE